MSPVINEKLMLQLFFVCCRPLVVNKITNDYGMPMTPISSKMSYFLGKKILNRRFCLTFFFTTASGQFGK